MISEMIVVDSQVLYLRTLSSYDYFEFLKLSKYQISKYEFIDKFVKNKKINSLVMVNPYTLDLVALSIKYKGKLKKIIFNKSYDYDKLMKYLINEAKQ